MPPGSAAAVVAMLGYGMGTGDGAAGVRHVSGMVATAWAPAMVNANMGGLLAYLNGIAIDHRAILAHHGGDACKRDPVYLHNAATGIRAGFLVPASAARAPAQLGLATRGVFKIPYGQSGALFTAP